MDDDGRVMNNAKQPIGYFEATSSGPLPETVIVSQETGLDSATFPIAPRKIFTLGTVDGEEIFRAQDPDIFIKKDGTRLKKVSCCRMYSDSSR